MYVRVCMYVCVCVWVCRLTLLYRPYRALWRLIMGEFVRGRLGFEKAPIGNGRIMSILILMLLFLNPACSREHATQTQKQRESERDACIHVIHIYICTHMYLSLSLSLSFPYIYKYIYIYIYIYIQCVYTYIHTYIHMSSPCPQTPRSTAASSPLLYRFLFHICTQDSNVPKALQIPTQSCLSARAYKPRCYMSRA